MIRVYTPFVAANQRKYVNECLDENMLTFHGKFVERFERQVAEYVGSRNCVAVANGSVALFAAYHMAETVCPQKVAITSTMTYAATVSQLLLAGWRVLLVDCDGQLQMDLNQLSQLLLTLRDYPPLVVVPHLYGDMADMGLVVGLCSKYGATLMEDAAEAFGCRRIKSAGTYGDMGTYSFFANKTITTGEGGAIVTDYDLVADHLRLFINQGVSGRFWHLMAGTNFRMTNLQAAIGCAQMEEVEEVVRRKQSLAAFYRENLDPSYGCLMPACESAEWMPVFRLPEGREYDKFQTWMNVKGVEVRPAFQPVHIMPAFQDRVSTPLGASRAETVPSRHFILPSSPGLSPEEMACVLSAANTFLLN